MAAGAERELTHDELWDDSALVESWNEALEEYKKYHSLAARGEKVPAAQIPKEQQLSSKAAAMLNGTRPSPQSESSVQASNSPATALPGNFIGPAIPPTQKVHAATAPPPPAVPSGSAAMPQILLGATTLDENMKNMMMSWYYAGYHLGLYEGQQRVWAQWQEAQQQEAQEEDEEYEPQLELKQEGGAG